MRREVIVPVVLLLGWWAVSVTRSLSGSVAPASPDVAPETRRPAATATTSSAVGAPVAATSATATPAAQLASPSSTSKGSSTMTDRPFEFAAELRTYLDLRAKIFLSPEEKRERADLLRHSGLLKALGRRLVEPTRSMAVMNEQDAAIDVLMEALKSGDAQVAGEVLQGVVRDGQVEDTRLDRGSREQLAGLKAEVLYQWSALSPAAASQLPSWLPGPVSRKIWANVVRMQQSNLAESAAEMAEAQGRHNSRTTSH